MARVAVRLCGPPPKTAYTMRKFIAQRLFACLVPLWLWACQQERPAAQRKPDKLLDKPVMVAVLADVLLAESAISLSGLTFQDGLARFDKYEKGIFSRYGIDSAVYRQSYAYYMQSEADMAELLQALNDTLLLRKDRKMKEAKLQDSLRLKTAAPPALPDSAHKAASSKK